MNFCDPIAGRAGISIRDNDNGSNDGPIPNSGMQRNIKAVYVVLNNRLKEPKVELKNNESRELLIAL